MKKIVVVVILVGLIAGIYFIPPLVMDMLSSKYLVKGYDKALLEDLLKKSAHFPVPPKGIVSDIEQPDLDIAISEALVRDILQQLLEGDLVLPLDKDSPKDNYFIIKKCIDYVHDPETQSLSISIGGSARYDKLFVIVHPTLIKGTLALTPKISITDDGKFMLTAEGTITDIKIKAFPTKFAKVLAHIATQVMRKDKNGDARPLIVKDVTEYFKPTFEKELLGKKIGVLPAANVTLVFENQILHLKAKL